MSTTNYRDRLNQMRGQQQTLIKDLDNKKNKKDDIILAIEELEQCTMLAQKAAKNGQEKLAERLHKVVTTAIQTVFEDPWDFRMVIETKGKDLQATPTFYKNGVEESPRTGEGGGMATVASLALRVSLLTLLKNPTPILLLDEALNGVGEGDIERTCKFFKTISKELGIQFIVITHRLEVKKTADRLFDTSMDSEGRSHVIATDIIKEKEIVEQ